MVTCVCGIGDLLPCHAVNISEIIPSLEEYMTESIQLHLLRPGQSAVIVHVGVLDWEMATLGDPLMDLGNTLAYWVQADDDGVMQMMRRQPTHLAGMLTRQEVIDYYGQKTGYQVDNFDFYSIYGLFRLAVIAQQIYYRFYHGQSKNAQFAMFGQMVNYLEQRCLGLIANSTL